MSNEKKKDKKKKRQKKKKKMLRSDNVFYRNGMSGQWHL